MGDVDHADALGLQIVHDLEQLFHLGLGQCGSGLVQHQQLAVMGDCLDDLDHLLLTNRQATQLHGGIDLDTDLLEQCLGVLHHLGIIDEGTLPGFPTDEDVLGHGQVVHHVQLLMDNADAHLLGIRDTIEVNRLTEIDDLAAVALVDAAEHLDQGGLTSTVFAHQRVYFAGTQFKLDTLQRMDTGEPLFDIFHLENDFAHIQKPLSYYSLHYDVTLCAFCLLS